MILRTLVDLYLDRNVLNKIDPDAFNGLENLEYLYLSGNKLSNPESLTFKSIKKLILTKKSIFNLF